MNLNKFDNDFIQYNKEKVKDEAQNLALYLSVHISLYILLLFFAIFFIWYTVFMSTHNFYKVIGPSMKNTFNSSIENNDITSSKDAVYVNKTEKISLFDVVVINRANKDPVIKRVMALEGDYVTIAKGSFTQNGETFDTFFFYRISAEDMKTLDKESFVDETAKLVENAGDNGYQIYDYKDWANASEIYDISGYESKFYWQFLEGEDLMSDEFFVSKSGLVYVKVPENKVFCLGDNRGHSSDSRENGFYSLDNTVGRVDIVVKNQNLLNRWSEVVKFYFSQATKFFAR